MACCSFSGILSFGLNHHSFSCWASLTQTLASPTTIDTSWLQWTFYFYWQDNAWLHKVIRSGATRYTVWHSIASTQTCAELYAFHDLQPFPASWLSMPSQVTSAHGVDAVGKPQACSTVNARFVALVSHDQQFKAHRNQFFTDIYQFVVFTACTA